MDEKKYLPRLVDKKISEQLSVFGAVCVEGPKWCGKTWTSQFHCKSKFFLGDPAGNFQNKRLAEISPDLVLDGEKPRLIDEWQEVPSIWDSVRYKVDELGNKGQYIFTGSSTPVQKGVLHSGAGRIATVKMRPMSLFESKDSSGEVSLADIFNGKFKPIMMDTIVLADLIDLIVRGGWPGSLKLRKEQYLEVTKQYLQAIIDHDIYRLEGINRDSKKMYLLLKSLARNESTTVSVSRLKRDIEEYENESIDNNTISTYLTLFERLFLLENQKSFSTNIRSSIRVKQSEKRHFVDPSLAVALLDVNQDALIKDLNVLGFLFEGLCERDLRIYAEASGGDLFHYQDYEGLEIDAVVTTKDGRWGAFEIKLGANQVDQAAENLLKIKRKLTDSGSVEPEILVVICGLSNAAYQREDGIYVVPITTLAP